MFSYKLFIHNFLSTLKFLGDKMKRFKLLFAMLVVFLIPVSGVCADEKDFEKAWDLLSPSGKYSKRGGYLKYNVDKVCLTGDFMEKRIIPSVYMKLKNTKSRAYKDALEKDRQRARRYCGKKKKMENYRYFINLPVYARYNKNKGEVTFVALYPSGKFYGEQARDFNTKIHSYIGMQIWFSKQKTVRNLFKHVSKGGFVTGFKFSDNGEPADYFDYVLQVKRYTTKVTPDEASEILAYYGTKDRKRTRQYKAMTFLVKKTDFFYDTNVREALTPGYSIKFEPVALKYKVGKKEKILNVS